MTDIIPVEATPVPQEKTVRTQPVATQIGEHALKFMPPSMIAAADAAARAGMGFIAKQMVDGKHLPEGVSPQGAILLMLAGLDYGLPPLEAISRLFLIGGRITPNAHEQQAMVMRKGVQLEVIESTAERAEIKLSRPGHADHVHEYTKETATRAGLWGKKGPWQNAPHAMLLARCKTEAFRVWCPDLLSSQYTVEELTGGEGEMTEDGIFTPDEKFVGDLVQGNLHNFSGALNNPGQPGFDPVAAVQATAVPATPAPEQATEPVKPRKTRNRPTASTEPAPEPAPEPEPTPAATPAPAAPEPAPTPAAPPAVPAPAPTPAPAPSLADALPIPKEGSFAARVMMVSRGAQTGQDRDGNPVYAIDSGRVANMILDHMQTVMDRSEAISQARAWMAERGAKQSAELSVVQLLQFCMWAEGEVEQRTPAAPLEVPAFEPNRGAATRPGKPVEDGQARDFDAEIFVAFSNCAEADLTDQANAIMEGTGYAEACAEADLQVKAETLAQLQDLLSGSQQAA